MSDGYWGNKEDKELLDALNGKKDKYFEYLTSSGLYYLYEKTVKAYMGGDLLKGTGWFKGIEIETEATKSKTLSKLKVNHFRSLIKHVIQIVASEQPAFACKASNSDAKSQYQTVVGNGVVDYYLKTKKIFRHIKKSLVKNILYGEGWIRMEWNPDLGEILDDAIEDDKKSTVTREGDIEVQVLTPLEVIRNTDKETDDHCWLILTEKIDKHLLAARFPEEKEKILKTKSTIPKLEPIKPFNDSTSDSDEITLYTFYHEKNELMPEGRMVKYLEDVILVDVDMPYPSLPAHCLKADDIENTSFGYSFAFDLVAPQQLIDVMNSTVATNQAQKASNPMWIQGGVEVEHSNGMKFIKTPVKPETLDVAPTSQETLNFRKELVEDMQLLSSVSSTIRGNPQASLKSGSALALVTNQSLQYHSLLEGSYKDLFEDVATNIIVYLQLNADNDRIVELTGIDNRSKVATFNKETLNGIKRVTVETTNPLSKTIAGRLQIADTLLERGLVKTPEKYLLILETGSLSQLTSGETSELISVKAENEAMQSGVKIPVIITDFHSLHVREHKALLSDPMIRQDAELVQIVLDHIQEHIDTAVNMPPNLAAFLRQEPVQAPPQPMGGGQGQGGPQGMPQPPAVEGGGQVMSTGESQSAQMPKMPKDALTGEQFQGDI